MQAEYGFRLGSYAIDPGTMLSSPSYNESELEQLEILFPNHYLQIIEKAQLLKADIEIIVSDSSNSYLDRTYTEINSSNIETARNKRACNIIEEYNPNNTNTAGVCFSSALDNWGDELIMQVFNHNTYNMPRIYGNPWFLKDDEFSKLARINSLHQEYQKILKNAIHLPKSYGINAMSKGNKSKRLLTLTNMSWEAKYVTVRLDEEIGLNEGNRIEIRSYLPTEKIIGYFPYSQILELEVPPFRTILYYIGSPIKVDFTITGLDYLLEKDNDKEMQLRIMEPPVRARKACIYLKERYKGFEVNGKTVSGRSIEKYRTKMTRRTNADPYYYKMIGNFEQVAINPEAETLYESTVFSSNNDALEARSIERSKRTDIEAVKNARKAFLDQDSFIENEGWDRYLFDENLNTAFAVNKQILVETDSISRCLRVDMNDKNLIDELRIIVENEEDLLPQQLGETYTVETSSDLVNWTTYNYTASLQSKIKVNSPIRYVRVPMASNRILEFEGYKNGFKQTALNWSANNLFPHPKDKQPVRIWKYNRKLRKIHSNAFLCIAIDGRHGIEGVYVTAKIDGEYVGCSNRSPSFPSNTWNKKNAVSDSNYTYFLPLEDNMGYDKIEIYVICYDQENLNIIPRVYMISDDPYNTNTLRVIK